MFNSVKRLFHNRKTSIAVACLVSVVTIGSYLLSGSRQQVIVKGEARSQPQPSQAQRSTRGVHLPRQKVDDLIVLELSPFGFTPNEIVRRQGHLVFSVTNRSKKDELTLQLKRIDRDGVRQFQLTRKTQRLREEIDLSSGEYLLTVAENPEWICRITITGK